MESRIKLLENGWSWIRMGFLSSRARTLSTGQPYNGCDLAELFAKSRRNLSTREPDHNSFSTILFSRDDGGLLAEGWKLWLFFFFPKLKCRKLT